MYNILLVEEIETYKYIKQYFYLLTKTWKYGGSVFGTEIAGGAQADSTPKYVIGIVSGLIYLTFS